MTMNYYPVGLDIRGKSSLVVGGGAVGGRKARTLAACGSLVTVISPEFTEKFRCLVPEKLTCLKKEYQVEDLLEKFLVVAATGSKPLNRQIALDAKARNILCNCVDAPDISSFIVPAIVQRGDLIITISTSGTSPAYAKKLRRELEQQFGDEYARFLSLMGAIRQQLLEEGHAPEKHKSIFETLIQQDLFSLVADEDIFSIDRLLLDTLGSRYTFSNLVSGDHQ